MFVATTLLKRLLDPPKAPATLNSDALSPIITFSTKAADELKERLIDGNIPASDVQKMHISTIHSFCLDILEKTGTVGLDVVADDGKLGLFIKKHISDLGFDNEFYLRGNYWIGKVIEKYDDFFIR